MCRVLSHRADRGTEGNSRYGRKMGREEVTEFGFVDSHMENWKQKLLSVSRNQNEKPADL